MPTDYEEYKDGLGIINTKKLTNLRIHRRGHIQYSYDNGENWHNCTDDFLNLYISSLSVSKDVFLSCIDITIPSCI